MNCGVLEGVIILSEMPSSSDEEEEVLDVEEQMLEAARYGDLEIMEELLTNEELRTKLVISREEGRGTEKSGEGERRTQPLHYAAANGHLKIVEMLLRDAGADPNAVNAYVNHQSIAEEGTEKALWFNLLCASLGLFLFFPPFFAGSVLLGVYFKSRLCSVSCSSLLATTCDLPLLGAHGDGRKPCSFFLLTSSSL